MVPIIVGCIKVFLNISFNNLYTMSYAEDIIFPFYKRATSAGICNFIARALTVLAPICAELDRPIPCIILLSSNFLALVAAFFLPSYAEQAKFEEQT